MSKTKAELHAAITPLIVGSWTDVQLGDLIDSLFPTLAPDDQVFDSTVLAADARLRFPVEAGYIYYFRATLFFVNDSDQGRIKAKLDVPAGSSSQWGELATDQLYGAADVDMDLEAGAANNAPSSHVSELHGWINVALNGEAVLQFALSDDATTGEITRGKGSMIEAWGIEAA